MRPGAWPSTCAFKGSQGAVASAHGAQQSISELSPSNPSPDVVYGAWVSLIPKPKPGSQQPSWSHLSGSKRTPSHVPAVFGADPLGRSRELGTSE